MELVGDYQNGEQYSQFDDNILTEKQLELQDSKIAL
jgi:hypothetical protein